MGYIAATHPLILYFAFYPSNAFIHIHIESDTNNRNKHESASDLAGTCITFLVESLVMAICRYE